LFIITLCRRGIKIINNYKHSLPQLDLVRYYLLFRVAKKRLRRPGPGSAAVRLVSGLYLGWFLGWFLFCLDWLLAGVFRIRFFCCCIRWLVIINRLVYWSSIEIAQDPVARVLQSTCHVGILPCGLQRRYFAKTACFSSLTDSEDVI
jgi:hypothetical protein